MTSSTSFNRGMKIFDSNFLNYNNNNNSNNNATTIEVITLDDDRSKYDKSLMAFPDIYNRMNKGWMLKKFFRYYTRTKYQREILWFFVAQLIGTLLFFILFESLYQLTAAEVEDAENVFSLAYVCSYWISILWQHVLNRWLVRSLSTTSSFCDSLCYTYAIYSLSLCIVTILSALILRLVNVNPNLLAMISLPLTGYLNWILLKYFISDDFL